MAGVQFPNARRYGLHPCAHAFFSHEKQFGIAVHRQPGYGLQLFGHPAVVQFQQGRGLFRRALLRYMRHGFYRGRHGVINEGPHIQRPCPGKGIFLVRTAVLALPQGARHFRAGSIGRFHGLLHGAGQRG